MPPFPQEVIDRVRQAADIADLIGRYVELKKHGATYKGLCPFHAEKTPSFTVNPERQIFKCFGCGEGGNVFGFLMKQAGLSFPEAVREVARMYNVDLPEPKADPRAEARRRAGERAAAVCRRAAKAFAANLAGKPGQAARSYLEQRGIGPEIVKRFGLGWALPQWDGLANRLRRDGVTEKELLEAGLVLPRKSGRGVYDRFRGRIIIPIADGQGRVVAFGGRGIEPDVEPKYLNSPETAAFKKGRLLYGLYAARDAIRRQGRAVVVEGYFDCLSLAAAGIDNAVATMGTALTGRQVGQLRGLGGEVILVFDADAAGLKAALRAQEIFTKENVSAKILSLPDGLDPDDYVRANGAEKFERLLDRAQAMAAFAIDRLMDRPLASPEDKGLALQAVAPVLNRISSPVEQAAYIRVVADRLGVAEAAVMAGLTRTGRDRPVEPIRAPEQTVGREYDFVAALINDSQCCLALMEAGVEEIFRDPVCRKVAEAALAAGRAGEKVDPASLIDRLDDQGAELVSRLTWTDGRRADDNFRQEMLAALGKLKRRLTSQDILEQLKAAEQAGESDKVMRLLALKKALDR